MNTTTTSHKPSNTATIIHSTNPPKRIRTSTPLRSMVENGGGRTLLNSIKPNSISTIRPSSPLTFCSRMAFNFQQRNQPPVLRFNNSPANPGWKPIFGKSSSLLTTTIKPVKCESPKTSPIKSMVTKQTPPARKQQSAAVHLCPLCEKSKEYSKTNSVTRHLRDVHKLKKLFHTKHCYCMVCGFFIADVGSFLHHLNHAHQLDFSNSQMNPGAEKVVETWNGFQVTLAKYGFDSYQEFAEWKKLKLEPHTKCVYVPCFSHDFPRFKFFKCSRVCIKSINYKLLHPNGAKHTDMGTEMFDNPLDARTYPCSSSFRVQTLPNGKVEVLMYPLHIGHFMDDQQDVKVIDVQNQTSQLFSPTKSLPDLVMVSIKNEKDDGDQRETNLVSPKIHDVEKSGLENDKCEGSAGRSVLPESLCSNDELDDLIGTRPSEETWSADEKEEIMEIEDAQMVNDNCSIEVSNVVMPLVELVAVQSGEQEIKSSLEEMNNEHEPTVQETLKPVEPTGVCATKSKPMDWPRQSDQINLVAIDEGMETVQAMLQPRKISIGHKFQRLLDACLTQLDLELIEMSLASVSSHFAPNLF